ncbi:MAG: DUF4147 domain-containing protein [Balneolaceae bacterium]
MKKFAVSIFEQTLDFVKPKQVLENALDWNISENKLSVEDNQYIISKEKPLYVIGFGKASAEMAKYVEELLGNKISDGMVITTKENLQELRQIQVFKGSHPLPDKKSLSSSLEILSFIKSIPENAHVLTLISGGASSLFCVPKEKLEVEDIRILYKLLVQSGATIQEINTVRKVFSAVKGGQLLDHLKHTTLIDLIISDVSDDDLSMVGSGPTIPQEISASDAFQILKQYQLYDKLPHNLRSFLASEMHDEVLSQKKRKTTDFVNHRSFIVASASLLTKHAASLLEDEGYKTVIDEKAWSGTIDDFEDHILEAIKSNVSNSSPTALLFFGECTIKVSGKGLGGRNQELVLRMADKLKDFDREIIFLSAGTDGIDGPTNAAGAVVNQNTFHEAEKKGLKIEEYLSNNDSYHFFDTFGDHIKPGGTGNNLMDLQIVLIP